MTYDEFMKKLAVSLFSVFWIFAVYSMLTRPERFVDGVLTVVVILSVIMSLAISKLGRKAVTLYEYGKWILGGFGIWVALRFIILGDSVVQGILAAIGSIGIMIRIIVLVTKSRLRDEREGFYVESHGGPEGGIVVYVEGSKRLVLLYSREKDTVFVPSEVKWNEIMPEWARERKNEIVARIRQRHGKRLIGKAIAYQETDAEEWMPAQVN